MKFILLILGCGVFAGSGSASAAADEFVAPGVHFQASGEKLVGIIQLGAITLDHSLSLPLSLVHTVRDSLSGPISIFRISPFETCIRNDPQQEGWLLWTTPFGEEESFPKPLLGATQYRDIRVEQRGTGWEFRYGSGLVLRYENGALSSVMNASGERFVCRGRGRWVEEIAHDGALLARLERTGSRWTVLDAHSGALASFVLNDHGQILSYETGERRAQFRYDARGLLAGWREGVQDVAVQARAPLPWDYEASSNSTSFRWSVVSRSVLPAVASLSLP